MSFVRAKEIPKGSGNWYDYEVATVHIGGKTIQKHIQYLGKKGKHNKPLIGHLVTIDTAGGLVIPKFPTPQKPRVACKFCDSQNTRKFGFSKGIQNYYCNDCRTKFIGTDALSHGRVSPHFIANALNEYYRGMSLHGIEQKIDQHTDYDISHTAIIKWINKYTAEAIRKTKDLKPEVGDRWIADETYIRVDKSRDRVKNPYDRTRKAKWVIFWDIIDADTRFLLASHLTTTRTKEDAKALMLKAAKRAGKIPKVVVTDRLGSYLDGIEMAFGADTKHKQGSPFDIENNTNLIERFHGSLKDRTKIMRALKNKSTLQRFSDGWLVHYNFFKPHMSLNNRPPAEAAGIKYDCKSWADIVGCEKQPIVRLLEPEPVKESA